MTIRIYNTLTKEKQDFVPIKENQVGIYSCGITAYDSCHMGHARGAMAFDMIVRYFRYKGFKVTFVRNYTDIDDKIINRANKENRDWKELAEFYIKEYADNMSRLGNQTPDIEPRATDHIKEMIETIQMLIDKGLAYKTSSGVYFSVRKFPCYGKLSGKNIEDLESGARVDVDEEKRDPLDFALWKASKPGEPKWQSPFGEGRPGWHIECSAMSAKYLGNTFDIHGGGYDLIFPHHENEIAQSEGAHGCCFANYWIHNGFLNIDSQKMSKSLGNFLSVTQELERHHPEAIRHFFLSSHYRSQLDYTPQTLGECEAAVDRFYETMLRLDKAASSETKPVIPAVVSGDPADSTRSPINTSGIKESLNSALPRIEAFMDDDFNTAGAYGVIFEIVRETNKALDAGLSGEEAKTLKLKWNALRTELVKMFGMFGLEPTVYMADRQKIASATKGVDTSKIESLIAERASARKGRDFAKADAAKKALLDMGVELRDKPDGTTEWKLK